MAGKPIVCGGDWVVLPNHFCRTIFAEPFCRAALAEPLLLNQADPADRASLIRHRFGGATPSAQ